MNRIRLMDLWCTSLVSCQMIFICGNIQYRKYRGAGVVESEDTADLKSAGVNPRAGSSPAARTMIKKVNQ